MLLDLHEKKVMNFFYLLFIWDVRLKPYEIYKIDMTMTEYNLEMRPKSFNAFRPFNRTKILKKKPSTLCIEEDRLIY